MKEAQGVVYAARLFRPEFGQVFRPVFPPVFPPVSRQLDQPVVPDRQEGCRRAAACQGGFDGECGFRQIA